MAINTVAHLAMQPQNALGNPSITVTSNNNDQLIVRVTANPARMASAQVLAFDDSVYVGLADTTVLGVSTKSSMLQRIETIVAANADNTFLFGDNWGETDVFERRIARR